MQRIIYHGFGVHYHPQIISNLYRKYKWTPVCLAGVCLDENNKLDGVPLDDCIISYPRRIRRAQFDYENLSSPIYIDEEILKKLSVYEGVYLDMIGSFQDPTGFLYPYKDRKNYYIDVLTYWNTIIQNKKPDIIVFYTWPHTPSCYALYVLAKYAYDIDILFIDVVPLLNQDYHLIQCSLEDLSYPLTLDLENVPKKITNKTFKSELIKEQVPDHVLIDIANLKKGESLLNRFIGMSKNKFKVSTLKKLKPYFKGENIDWKKNNKPYDITDSRMNRIQMFIMFEKFKYKNRRLKKIYSRKTNIPILEENYIYFPAPYQPEAMSAVTASFYENLIFTLSLLSSACPSNWSIYYKEHPSSFYDNLRGNLKRSEWLYERISKLENVKLVPVDFSQFELIENSKAVAVIHGSAPWEALLRDKLVISFGQGWYSGLKSVIRIVSLKDLHAAIKLIQMDCKPNDNELNQYVNAIKAVAFKFPESYSQEPFDEKRAELIADEFVKAHKRLYKLNSTTADSNTVTGGDSI